MKKTKGSLVTIGSFDGVHRGHIALLDRAVHEARKRRLESVALTFNIPPRMVLNQTEPRSVLSSPFEKELLIKSRGIRKVVVLPFHKEFSKIKPYTFFRDILLNKLKAKGVVVGLDFRFGMNRSAGAMELVRWGQEMRIPIWVIPQVKYKREVVSSSGIRHLLLHNELNRAVELLGHPYMIEGRVIHGRGLGRKIGYPTTNIRVEKGKILPTGVFVVRGWESGRKDSVMKGVCNIGRRPTFYQHSPLTIEPHWLPPMPKRVPKSLIIELLHRLRGEKKFRTVKQLQQAIKGDIQKAQRLFKRGFKFS